MRKCGPSPLTSFLERFGFLEADSDESITEVINFVNLCIRDEQPPDSDFKLDVLRTVRSQLLVELSLVIGESPSSGKKVRLPEDAEDQPGTVDLKLRKYFRQFASGLRRRSRRIKKRLSAGDVVITTNYDMNVDVALYELAYDEQSPLSDVYLGSDFRDPYEDEFALSDPRATVDLFKLHGSLNWLYCPKCTRIFVAAFGFSVRFLTSDDPGDELLCFCGFQPLEPVMIAPSSTQDVVNLHLRSIWANAHHALEQADEWVIAGYSLPPDDLAVRSLFHRARASRDNLELDPPAVIVVNRNAELKRRFIRVFGPDVSFHAKSFESWVRARFE